VAIAFSTEDESPILGPGLVDLVRCDFEPLVARAPT
jgi:hypothetical protein